MIREDIKKRGMHPLYSWIPPLFWKAEVDFIGKIFVRVFSQAVVRQFFCRDGFSVQKQFIGFFKCGEFHSTFILEFLQNIPQFRPWHGNEMYLRIRVLKSLCQHGMEMIYSRFFDINFFEAPEYIIDVVQNGPVEIQSDNFRPVHSNGSFGPPFSSGILNYKIEH